MGNAPGVSRDYDALERRRMEATGHFREGLNNSEIGRRLKVSNQTVSRWRKEQGVSSRRQEGATPGGSCRTEASINRGTEQGVSEQTDRRAGKAGLSDSALDLPACGEND